ncbi:SNF2-related protein [Hymenobacter glacieicola]|uniref:Helicase SNF2 n=1 Tax=Hymenobacter glacieicola TaxID=1562124 RepID=A0ABQ1WL66_9BACT|nr:SNF2-related protein [Hymenobacter glacieicola]GGG35556.1 helicase SNF2 [Hymenobacter glacieicola]
MVITDYHTKYFAHELTRRFPSDDKGKLSSALVDARVDLNPHQVDAALFAFRSPLAKGALLADEVGLGKTIEAGLVLSQKWAERKRRILIIVPANLRKQWYQELTEKFFLPCRILESKSYKEAQKQDNRYPFNCEEVVICSYAFAANKDSDVQDVPWDLVVIDEAHRLRNVYKPQNITANKLKFVLAGREKLLLTATPLQNSLLELYGLISFIDEHTFGNLKSFREQFANLNQDQVFQTLKARLQPLCHRTLRRQVEQYVPYTKRFSILERFTPDDNEHRLYEMVSEYLQRDNLQALPPGQRTLTTLVLRKLLASSTFAIAGALQSMAKRLQARLERHDLTEAMADAIEEDYEAFESTADEWQEHEPPVILSDQDKAALQQEIQDLQGFATLAASINENAKGRSLLTALRTAFAKAKAIGAEQKAIIFTESRKTQHYLLTLLGQSEFAEGIVLFNGSNNDLGSRQIYKEWLAEHRGSDRVTGSPTADMRSALVDYFREKGHIMIATEAGAEGINLQFCSLIVNYDLPWNPQRIEQRIGRCHRYGQKHDVVVVNFLNTKNKADERVYELLDQKFTLFDGVFGASDEVLGAIESGVDFEKRISAIYHKCRKPEDIEEAFNKLQEELKYEINETMTLTQRKLLEHFDDEVRDKLRGLKDTAQDSQNRFERLLMLLTKHELGALAYFTTEQAFDLLAPLPAVPRAPLGRYELPRSTNEAHFYRLGHPLAQQLVAQAKNRELPPAEVVFDYSQHEGRVTVLENLQGQSGWAMLSCFSVESPVQGEDYLLFSAATDEGQTLDQDTVSRLLRLTGEVRGPISGMSVPRELVDDTFQQQRQIQRTIEARNANFFEAEVQKLDGWADDMKVTLERDIREMDRQIKEARRAATAALTLQAKLEGQKQLKSLEAQRNQKRRALFDAQDEVDQRREELIKEVEGKLKQRISMKQLFVIRWTLS